MSTRLPVLGASTEVQPAESGFDPGLSPKRIFVDTFGCQMNVHDSQRMVSLMAGEGYLPTETPDDADLIVLNSCSVRDKAENKVRSRAGEMKKFKASNPNLVLAIGGCVAQQEGQRMLNRIPHADLVFGPDHVGDLPEMVARVVEDRRRTLATEWVSRDDYKFPPPSVAGPRLVSAYVSVMKGWYKFCTFCVVPFTRGREVSRAAADILAEVRALAEQGSQEIILLGQTVNTYGRQKRSDEMPFAELLAEVAAVEGIQRVRFTSPHPSDFTEDQIQAYVKIPELCPHMHLPVQSGSSKILKAMNRSYTREEYLRIVDRLREVAPQVGLTTDIIVGFPGETEEDFQETLSLVEYVRFQAAFSFAYSERTNTKAPKMDGEVEPAVRMRRLHELMDVQNRITAECLQAMVGTRQTVLVEGPSRTDPNRSTGRTGSNRPCHLDGVYEQGSLLEVEVTEALAHSLLARPV